MTRAVTAAIVGAGPAGLLHGLALRAAGARIVRVVDRDVARAKALAEVLGGSASEDVADLVGAAFDVVTIASPPRWHVAHAVALASSARRLVVEKPVATSATELATLAELGDVVPVLQWREGRGLRAVRRAMADSLFGDSPSVAIDVALARDADYRRARCGGPEWGAGALLSVGIHALDAACFALGRLPDRALAIAPRRAGEHLESHGVVVVSAGGALISMRVTFEAGASRVSLTFAGGGLSATLLGSESDPTARMPRWASASSALKARAAAIAAATPGANAPPLVVPFFARVVASCADARARADLPSIADVAACHLALMDPATLR